MPARTLVCVPVMVEDIDAALADAALAKLKQADLVEWRIDPYFDGSGGDAEDGHRVAQLQRLLAESPLPCILTCRSADEGGHFDGDDADRVSLLEKLTAGSDHPPAYLDFELAAYQRSANIRQKINLCVAHPKQQRGVTTRLILSMHDFQGMPSDLHRRLLAAYEEPACAVVKVACRARSLRDNLDLFELLEHAPKPTIALGMGEFGLMSRVLAPKFGGYLTFASLRDSCATAPGQPTIDQLLGMYHFRGIGAATKVYGVIGWPVGHSLSPQIHNAGFDALGWDGVYLPLPVAADASDPEGSDASFKATVGALAALEPLKFSGASVTIPHKERVVAFALARDWPASPAVHRCGAANTLSSAREGFTIDNTDAPAIAALLSARLDGCAGRTIGIVGAGGVARAAAADLVALGATVVIYNRTVSKAQRLADDVMRAAPAGGAKAVAAAADLLPKACCHALINCTPIGMAGGPDPAGASIPVRDLKNIGPETVFFDTVYNPIDTPMLRMARELGYPTIDGVEMFVKQAAMQFQQWTGNPAPTDLFDTLCRQRLAERSV